MHAGRVGCTRYSRLFYGCVEQNIVSKAEGQIVDLGTVASNDRGKRLAHETGKDPRRAEVNLADSRRVVCATLGLVILEHCLGFVMVNAGVEQSNVLSCEDDSRVLFLPVDPQDANARRLLAQLVRRSGANVGVLVIDSMTGLDGSVRPG